MNSSESTQISVTAKELAPFAPFAIWCGVPADNGRVGPAWHRSLLWRRSPAWGSDRPARCGPGGRAAPGRRGGVVCTGAALTDGTLPGTAYMVAAMAAFATAAATAGAVAIARSGGRPRSRGSVLGGITPMIYAVNFRIVPVFARRTWPSPGWLRLQVALALVGAWMVYDRPSRALRPAGDRRERAGVGWGDSLYHQRGWVSSARGAPSGPAAVSRAGGGRSIRYALYPFGRDLSPHRSRRRLR